MSFREWLQLNEDGYIYLSEPMPINLGDQELVVDMIDLRLELWYSKEKENFEMPGNQISLKVGDQWLNVLSRLENKGFRIYDAEPELTPQPKYEPFKPDHWNKVASLYHKGQFADVDDLRTTPAIDWTPDTWLKAVG